MSNDWKYASLYQPKDFKKKYFQMLVKASSLMDVNI